MIDKLKQHEKAWAEFVEWMESEHNYIYRPYNNAFCSFDDDVINFVPNRELRSLLIEFLDSKGILVEVDAYRRTFFEANIRIDEEDQYIFVLDKQNHSQMFSSRPEAEEQGIIKGIEIYNNQLNQKEK